jgi:hypothetical protein
MAQKITYVGEINATRTYILPNVHQDPRQFLTINCQIHNSDNPSRLFKSTDKT